MSLDLLAGDFYVSDPYTAYAWHREHEPVAWDSANELWGVFRYDDVLRIEKDKETFVNSDRVKGGYRPNIPADPAIIGLDDPEHARRRGLVARRFTPRAAHAWEADIRAIVTELLDAALAQREVEIVSTMASVLPARTIARLLGFADDDWPLLREWSERTIMLGGGPRYFSDDGIVAAAEFHDAALALYDEKCERPGDDVMTAWTTATIDGCPLTRDEVASDGLLLLDGGAETTRTVIARTILNLIGHPDAWSQLRAGADLTVATEEFIRYVTPIHNMCRVARHDVEVGGATIGEGQQLVLMYASANRDPDHFADPERFDVTRHPNNHLAFGFGTHFCLGAALARVEIRVFFEEFVRRVANLRLVPGTEVIEMPNAFVYGLAAAHVTLDPA